MTGSTWPAARVAINQITTPRWTLPEAIEGYSGAGIAGIGIWRDRLAEYGLARARHHLRDAGMWVPSLCKAGDVARLDEAGPQAAVEDVCRAVDEAAEIGAPAIVFVCGGKAAGRTLEETRGRVAEVLAEAAGHAAACGVRIGVEPFHPMHAAERGCVNTIAQARALQAAIGPAVALIIDVFHCWWDPALAEGIAPVETIASVHLCDWRVPTRHPVMDRAMPGDGAADIAPMLGRLHEGGYAGPFEIEVFSEDWAARDPAVTVAECIARFRRYGLL